jgi:hypothetical protein
MDRIVNQALIDEIVTSVLAQLQPASARPASMSQARPQTVTPVSSPSATPANPANASSVPLISTVPAVASPAATPAKPAAIELTLPIITADVLEQTVRAGQAVRIGRNSILTPSARDWLNSKRTPWTRQDKASGTTAGSRAKWQVILQTVTPTVRSLQDGLRRLADGWKVEIVGQPLEAAVLATSLVSTAECDGVVIFTEQAELIACRANRNERVRAAVMQNPKQWEQVVRSLGANVVCISPIGRTFIELRNLLRDCAATRPRPPAGM